MRGKRKRAAKAVQEAAPQKNADENAIGSINSFNRARVEKVRGFFRRADLITKPEGKERKIWAYYSVNTSPSGEPIEQFDPLLLAGMWNRMAKEGGAALEFGILLHVGSAFRAFNLREKSCIEKSAAAWRVQAGEKIALHEKAAGRLGVELLAITPESLWNEEGYWKIFMSLAQREWKFRNGRDFNGAYQKALNEKFGRPLLLGEIPKGMFGAMPQEVHAHFSGSEARRLFLYAEIAALHHACNKYGVSLKIGHQSEDEYDVHIRRVPIIKLFDPLDFASAASKPLRMNAYIAKSGQNRILASDAKKNGKLSDIIRNLTLIADRRMRGGPLDQWKTRIALLDSKSEADFLDQIRDMHTNSTVANRIEDFVAFLLGGNEQAAPIFDVAYKKVDPELLPKAERIDAGESEIAKLAAGLFRKK